MPAVDVAPIYSDPFVQDHYEGMAKLIEAVPDTADRTINGITCRFYCIRFFYTSVNRRRWVEVSAITTWQDSEDLYSTFYKQDAPITGYPYWTGAKLEATLIGGTIANAWFHPPSFAVDRVLLGFGLDYSIETSCNAQSNITARFVVRDSAILADPVTLLKEETKSDQVDVFTPWYMALAEPRTIASSEHYMSYFVLRAFEEAAQNGFVSIKAPYWRFERSI